MQSFAYFFKAQIPEIWAFFYVISDFLVFHSCNTSGNGDNLSMEITLTLNTNAGNKTMPNMPHNVTELMTMAADALNELDLDRLEDLKNHVSGWLQTDEELNAQLEMLDAMAEAAARLEYHGE